ncbi:MAG: hypothetical protein ACRD1G_04290, partial [Acidimicrobiales bacterium]
LSYLRRLTQGRLDIVQADLDRRTGGGNSDISDLVDRLPEILSERGGSSGTGHLPLYMAPDMDGLAAELDAVVGVERLGQLPSMSDDSVRALAEALEEHETRLSAERRALHHRIDRLQDEIVGRYKRGDVNVDNLLR